MMYKLEQLMMENNGIYKKICNMFFELNTDDEIKNKLEEILYEGKYQDFYINSEICSNDNPLVEIGRRMSMAYLLIRNPETFNILMEKRINIFHGTNANALPNILKYGLNSASESTDIGIDVITGEKSTRINNKRSFISFTDVLDVALSYSTIKTEKGVENLSFEIVIGTTVDEIMKSRPKTIRSDVVEIGVDKNFPLEKIKMIGVPSDKVDFVKKLVKDQEGITVVAIDGISEKFYSIDNSSEMIYILENEFEKLKSNLKNSTNNKVFSLVELKNLMIERFSNVLEKFLPEIAIELNKSDSTTINRGGR